MWTSQAKRSNERRWDKNNFMNIDPLWAVHIADGVLTWPWLAGGFALIGLLALLASWRVREEEIPRIALLTAEFFVASSIHVKLGFSSAHLLLNGLVGVILGWRAPLAILLGVTMQALLIAHGGVSTIGVNACTEALPALLVWALFRPLFALTHSRHTWLRSLLVAATALLLGICCVFAITLFATNPLRGILEWNSRAGLVLTLEHFSPAKEVLLHPATLASLAVVALIAVALERRQRTAPEFALGAFLGVLSVMATTFLTGLVLLVDGADRWSTIVSAILVVHLPIALVEGLILGCMLGFLARVKPEMLGVPLPASAGSNSPEAVSCSQEPVREARFSLTSGQPGVIVLLTMGALFLSAGTAQAHRLQAEHKVDRANRRVTVESWYETDEVPHEARAKVLRPDGSVLAEGALDAKGNFVFAFEKAEPLTVHITAPGGHRATCKITAEELEGASTGDEAHPANEKHRPGPPPEGRFQELAVGVALVLAAAAFVMSWANYRRLRRLEASVSEKHR
jgi:cobalt/nickel transport system permease protein